MLFNSYFFIFVFLPITLMAFHLLRVKAGFRWAMGALVASSLFFYGWWSPKYLALLGALIVLNFYAARILLASKGKKPELAKVVLGLGIAANLGVLFYFKYANFLVDTLNAAWHFGIELPAIILPIGISFFTFQKIAFLVDVYEGKVGRIGFMDYALFVTFFPQLIAGPITHHSEVIPQFTRDRMKVSVENFQLGMTYFVIGLTKKVVLADTAAGFAVPHFQTVSHGGHLDFIAAWTAALAYSVQLYFDFSAYSDMAIGLGQFFGIHLPLNFNSPYKALSIIEFWRRWHMTLSRFLRDYLYIPLGGSRCGPVRRHINLFLTMLLGGIWHGAGWTFVAWGALHGAYLTVNHVWRGWWGRHAGDAAAHPVVVWLGGVLTFLAVVVGWVFFRSADVAGATDVLWSMAGGHGFHMGNSVELMTIFVMLLIAWFAPNTQQLTGYTGPESTNKNYADRAALGRPLWSPNTAWAVALGCMAAVSLTLFTKISQFIYFQF